MPSEDAIEIEGVLMDVLPNKTFWVKLPNGHRVMAHLPRRQQHQAERMTVGQKVILEMTPYDFSQGRIKV